MEFFQELMSNRVLITAIMGWFVAQVLKTLIHLIVHKKFEKERLVGDGGMPSAHSSTVCALATATLLNFGVGSFEFAVTCMLAIIVMHDAMGVRRETGIQAKRINAMMELLVSMGSDLSAEEKLKELVGHTPFQVLVGGVLGVVVALVTNLFL